LRYGKGVLLTLLTKGIALPIGIASSVIIARYLGPSGRGVLALLIVLQGFAIQFGTLGFNASITYFISRDKNSTSRVVTTSVLVGLVVSSLIALILFLAGRLEPKMLLGQIDVRYLHVFLVALPFSFLQQLLQNVFIARQAIFEFNALDLIVRLLQLIAYGVVLVFLGLSTYEAALAFVAVTVVAGSLYFIRTFRYVQMPVVFDWTLLASMLRYGLKTYVASLFMFLAIRINLFLINTMLGEYDSGVYSVALQISDMVYLIPATLGMMLFPKVSEDVGGSVQLTIKAFRITFVLMILMVVAILAAGKPIVYLLYGEKFWGAVRPLYMLTPGIVCLSLVMILNNDLAGRGLPWVVILAPALGAIINAGLNVLFVRPYGIIASGFASSVAHLVMLLVLLGWYVRHLGINLSMLLIPRRNDFDWGVFRP